MRQVSLSKVQPFARTSLPASVIPWLKSDSLYRQAQQADLANRSAQTLLSINATWGKRFLSHPSLNTFIELGAAPGGWSYALASKLGWYSDLPTLDDRLHGLRNTLLNEEGVEYDDIPIKDPWDLIEDEEGNKTGIGRGTIIALDTQPIKPVRGVHRVQADFFSSQTEVLIRNILRKKQNHEKADVILSDMFVPPSGNRLRDVEVSLDMCRSVLGFAQRYLRTADEIGWSRGGILLMRYTSHPLLIQFRHRMLMPHFRYVYPINSRTEYGGSGAEHTYFLCQGWRGNPTRPTSIARILSPPPYTSQVQKLVKKPSRN